MNIFNRFIRWLRNEDKIDELTQKLEAVQSILDTYKIQNDLEFYWNTKRTSYNDLRYKAREGLKIDPRIFFGVNGDLPKFNGCNDDIAIQTLDWTYQNIKYKSEAGEFWKFTYETLNDLEGDCEDMAILIANALLNNGVPYWRIRLNAGNSEFGGHCWVTYLAEKDNKWYILDSALYYNECSGLRKLYKEAEHYYSIWFSWNTKYIYPDEKFERES